MSGTHMPTPDHLTVTFDYSAADHAHALAEERRSMFFGWWWRPLNIVVMAIIFGRQTDRGGNDLLGNLILLTVFLPFAAFLVFMPEFVRSRDHARFRREAAKRDDLVETRTFGPDGFRPGMQWPQPIPWSLITRATEAERYFFIYHSTSHWPEYVPKASMSQAEIERLRMILQEELRSRHAELRLLSGTA